MDELMEQLVEFGASWNLKLSIEKDADVDGKWIHRITNAAAAEGNDGSKDFFWVLPEEQKVCVCVPGDSNVEEVKHMYAVQMEECRWGTLPKNTRCLCLEADHVNLGNVLCREFIQHMMAARASQFGMELRMDIEGNAGGCGGA